MLENKIIVSSVNNGCVVGVMDLVHGPNRRFTDDVCSMMKSCDCIFLCNTEYHKVHKLLKSIMGDSRVNTHWVARGVGESFYEDGEWVRIQDVIIRKKDLHTENEIWYELRVTPLIHKYIDQSDLVWCPGLQSYEHSMNNMHPDKRITQISDWEREKSCESNPK